MKRLKTGDKVSYKTKNNDIKTATVQRAFYKIDNEYIESNEGYSLEAWCDKTGNMLLLFDSDVVE